jgi:hypothetical protein
MKIYLVALVLLLGAAAFVFCWIRPRLTGADFATLRVETLKTSLQLVAVGIGGGFLTWLLGERSKERDREIADERQRRDVKVQDREKELQRLREQHEAVTVFRREALARLVSATNLVRKAPLLIEAHRSKLTYGNELRALLDVKLELGLLRHQIEDVRRFTAWTAIGSAIRDMEEYLGLLIAEWRLAYLPIPVDPAAGWPVIEKLPELKDLREATDQSRFESQYLANYKSAIRLMSQDILGPPPGEKEMSGK